MTSRSTRRGTRLATLAAASTIGLTALVAGAAPAHAAYDSWDCYLGSGKSCRDDRHTLVSVRASNRYGAGVGAGASWYGNTDSMYGSFAYGNGYTCHDYGAGNVLYPLIKNNSGNSGTISGTSTWGSGADSC